MAKSSGGVLKMMFDLEEGQILDSACKKSGKNAGELIRSALLNSYQNLFRRTCTTCGKPMVCGFVVEDGLAYFCSEECLHMEYSVEEYNEMHEAGNAYYTEWEEYE